jgi:short-subunit dehydrogenase
MSNNNIQNFMNWDNPGTALITGASSGIGAEFARQLAKQGFDLILIARRKDKLEKLKEDLHGKYAINTEILVADLSLLSKNQEIAEKISKLDKLDILINNAGFSYREPFLEGNYKLNVDMIMVHLTSPVIFCQAALPNMIKRKRGVIINTSSLGAILRSGIMYSTTKAAVALFSELLKRSIKQKDIYIQALCPGFTHTEFHDSPTMKGFSRTIISEENWMSAEEVVSLSLNAVKSNQIIFIPGEANQDIAKKVRKTNMNKYLSCKIM